MQFLPKFPARTLTAVLSAGLLITLAPPSPHAEPGPVEFTLSPRGHILIPVTLADGSARQFVLDTAAGSCVITPTLAQELDLPVHTEKVSVMGEQGGSRQDAVTLDGVQFGGRQGDDLFTVVQDLAPFTRGAFTVDGILGIPFLRRFDVRIDFPNRTVTLFDRADEDDCPVCPAEGTPVPMDLQYGGHILVPSGIGDQDMTALIDTGSGHSGINGMTARAMGVELPDPPPGGHGFGIETGPFRVGTRVFRDRGQVAIMDRPDIFVAFDLVDKPRLLMGTDLLAGSVLSISYGREVLFLQ